MEICLACVSNTRFETEKPVFPIFVTNTVISITFGKILTNGNPHSSNFTYEVVYFYIHILVIIKFISYTKCKSLVKLVQQCFHITFSSFFSFCHSILI